MTDHISQIQQKQADKNKQHNSLAFGVFMSVSFCLCLLLLLMGSGRLFGP